MKIITTKNTIGALVDTNDKVFIEYFKQNFYTYVSKLFDNGHIFRYIINSFIEYATKFKRLNSPQTIKPNGYNVLNFNIESWSINSPWWKCKDTIDKFCYIEELSLHNKISQTKRLDILTIEDLTFVRDIFKFYVNNDQARTINLYFSTAVELYLKVISGENLQPKNKEYLFVNNFMINNKSCSSITLSVIFKKDILLEYEVNNLRELNQFTDNHVKISKFSKSGKGKHFYLYVNHRCIDKFNELEDIAKYLKKEMIEIRYENFETSEVPKKLTFNYLNKY